VPEHQTDSGAARRRRIIRLLGPILVSGVLLVALEAALRLAGFEVELSAGGDPKANQTALFRAATQTDGVAIMQRPDLPVAFRSQKPSGGLRVFVIGESSVWGFPYGPDLAFTRVMQDQLEAAWPDRPIEVVNCGVPAIASWHARRIVEEIAQYQPDVVVIYTGHNDWVIPGPEAVSPLARAAAQFRFYQLAVVSADAWRRWRHGPLDSDRLQVPREPYGYARDRARGRATMTARDRAWVMTRFRDNLRAMVGTAQAAGATVIIAGLGQNLSDFAPGASRHRPGLSADQRARWRTAVEEADALAKADDCEAALERLDAARRIDSRPAQLHFARGKCLDRLGRFANARAAYRLASDLDEIPLGTPSSLNRVMREVAADMHAQFVDVPAALERDSPHGLVGSALFIDHLHPNLAGHAAIGSAITAALGVPVRADGTQPLTPPPDAIRRIAIARIPLYLVLGWYDTAAQEAHEAGRRYPDIQLDDAIARLRSDDPLPIWSDPIEAPD
jgi:lysophospholipase L1-like esterase